MACWCLGRTGLRWRLNEDGEGMRIWIYEIARMRAWDRRLLRGVWGGRLDKGWE